MSEWIPEQMLEQMSDETPQTLTALADREAAGPGISPFWVNPSPAGPLAPRDPDVEPGAIATRSRQPQPSRSDRVSRHLAKGTVALALSGTIAGLLAAAVALFWPGRAADWQALGPLVSGLASAASQMASQITPSQISPTSLTHSGPAQMVGSLQRSLTVLVVGVEPIAQMPPGAPERFDGPAQNLWLVRFDREQNRLSVLTLPRDTTVEIPGQGEGTIAQAKAIGGLALLRKTIAANFWGLNIDRSLVVDVAALRGLVDRLGGLELFVPRSLVSSGSDPDGPGEKTVHLPADQATEVLRSPLEPGLRTTGWQALDGQGVATFAGHPGAGPGSTSPWQRQEILLATLLSRLTEPGLQSTLADALKLFQHDAQTDLSGDEVLAIGQFLANQEPDQQRSTILPGWRDQANGPWQMDLKARDRLLRDWFLPQADRSAISNDVAFEQIAKATARISVQGIQVQGIQVQGIQVQGVQVPGLQVTGSNPANQPTKPATKRSRKRATKPAIEPGVDPVTEQVLAVVATLRSQGFTQVRAIAPLAADEQPPSAQTQIIAQTGDLDLAGLVHRSIGRGQVTPAAIGDSNSEITIRLGSDPTN